MADGKKLSSLDASFLYLEVLDVLCDVERWPDVVRIAEVLESHAYYL